MTQPENTIRPQTQARTAATYRNPWHDPTRGRHDIYNPVFYTTEAQPRAYRGYLIYERIKGCCWDVVKDGVCITQRAGGKLDAVIDAIIATSDSRAMP